MPPTGVMGPAEVAILETFVVPRFLTLFGDTALRVVLSGDGAAIAHLGCRTGYPDRELVSDIDNCSLIGVDASAAAVELARNKAATLPGGDIRYYAAAGYPTPLPQDSFSHALSLYPIGTADTRAELFAEMQRVLYGRGQAVVALPLRGSFQELTDLLCEYCLKHDDAEMALKLEAAAAACPNEEAMLYELEAQGFEEIEVGVVPAEMNFENGRAFIEDPTTRLLILPEMMASAGLETLGDGLSYVREAIDKYWAESEFTLTINVGVASARKPE
jgi:SAM-dependent methyltransferase